MNKEDIEELKREIKALKQANIEYKDRIDSVLEVLNQSFPNYASCIKALDEIEEVLRGESNE